MNNQKIVEIKLVIWNLNTTKVNEIFELFSYLFIMFN